MTDIERVELASGYSVSRLFKGGWQLSSGHNDAVARNEAIDDMAAFVQAGYTTFDCADHYLGVEQMIGDFRRAYPELAPRVQVHSKYVPDRDALGTLKREDTVRIIDRSLQRLGVERLDLLQFFWWDWQVGRVVDTWRVLGDLVQAGKIRCLGVTNFTTPQLQELTGAGVPVLAVQLQYSLVDRRPETAMKEYCRRRGIHLLTYGHLLGGFMSEKWLGQPEPKQPFTNRSLTKYKLIIDDFGGWSLFQELLAALDRVGKRYGVGLGEVALRWTLDQGAAACIVGATSRRYMERNTKVFDVALTAQDRAELEAVSGRRVGPPGDCYELENDKNGKHGSIMRTNQNRMEDAPWPGAKPL